MEKYLFADGTNVIREVETRGELQSLIQSAADPAKVRIWIFSTSEWITVADLNKRNKGESHSLKVATAVAQPTQVKKSSKKKFPTILKRTLIGVGAALVIFLVYNFTRVSWARTTPIDIVAERPANAPFLNTDSIAALIEAERFQKLDKVTRTNLRIRNSWPDLIQLRVTAERDTNKDESRYHDPELTIDNSTGYAIDNAVVRLILWRRREIIHVDTIHFTNIGYATPGRHTIEGLYRGDSISAAFMSIRAKSFNFCYSVDKKSNYGNYNDRWFCKE